MAKGTTQKVTIIGNIGADPETQVSSETNKSFTFFSMATTEVFKSSKGEKQEKTQWHDMIAFGKCGELIADMAKKGTKMFVMGHLSYQSKQIDGKTYKFAKIVVDEFELL